MELLTLKKFNDPVLAQNMADILGNNGIVYTLDEAPAVYNPSIVNQADLLKEYELKIDSSDFTRANQLIADYEKSFINDVEPDYYLFSFTDEELMEILTRPDEWSTFDHELAKKLLNERGIVIDNAAEKRLNEKRLEELKQPEPSQSTYIYLGYLFALVGGVLGFFIGWHLQNSKKTLPNGEQIYSFLEQDRKQGKRIFILSIIGLIGAFYLRYIFTR